MEKNSIDVEHSARKRGSPPPKASLERSARIPIPKTTSGCRISPGQSRRKRVKFAGSASICESDGGLDIPLLENKGLSNVITSKSDVSRLLSPIQNVSSVVQGSLSSPAQILHKHEDKNKGKGKIGETRSVQFSKTTPTARPFHPSPLKIRKSCGEHSRLRYEHEGIFSEKKENLLQLAAMTWSQNVDDFFSNRSDFIIEFLQRLGIRRKSSEHDRLPKSKLTTGAHQISHSSKRSNTILEFYKNSEENSCDFKRGQDDNYSTSVWDKTVGQAFPCNDAPHTSSKCMLWKSDLVLNENSASFLHDFHKSASAIDLSENFDCNKYKYNYMDCTLSKDYALLNSPCEFDEVNACPPDYSVYMRHLNKCLHINSTSKHKGLYEFCFTNTTDPTVNSKAELRNYGCHRNLESYQADCITPNSYNSEIYFQKQELVPYINEFSTGLYVQSPDLHLELTKDQQNFPLLEWDATVEQEPPTPKFLVPKEVNHFSATLYGTPDNQLNFPLLEWDATVDQEPPAPKFLVPKEVNHFSATLYGTPDNQINFPLLEWDATAEQEITTPKFLVPKEVDHFPAALYDTPDFHNVYGRRGSNCYDGMRENATHQSVLDGIIYATSTPVPVSLLKLKSLHNCSDRIEDSSIYSEYPFSMVMHSGEAGWLLAENRHSNSEDDINFISYPENKFGFTESSSWDVVSFSGMKNFTSLSDRQAAIDLE